MSSNSRSTESPSFVDPRLAQQFEREGYVVIPLLTKDDIEEVNAIYHRFSVRFETGWHTDMYSHDLEYRRVVHEQVGVIFERRLKNILDGYRFCCGNFVVKEPSPLSAVPLHQDWTIIDPDVSRSLNVICPLIDTNSVNGQLNVVPGSHHPPSRISFGPIDEILLEPLLPEIRSHHLQALEQKAGDALIYDGRVLHSSEANQSDSTRICFSAGFVPRDIPLRHYYRDPENPSVLEVYEITDDFFWKHILGERPRDAKFLGIRPEENTPITREHLAAWSRGRTA
jgi:hypothetical protein